MSLAPGRRLGPYEVTAAIGAGGMGEVYRAHDTRLGRTVAIKVLPEHVAADPDFKARFEREARTLSSLNHPHVCAIHDVGHQDGIDYLVMELVEGETLADRLERGPLPLDTALKTAVEIADALDKAHHAGIVHRDLKPGNIMLTKAGAKLLDFGLAKMAGVVASGAGLSMLPTTPANLTAQGTILGTFQYMAPEQLDGREADARTDIFAFGAVLYETITGRKAFEGKSHASLIHAIMGVDPPPVSTIQRTAPASLDEVIRTCLAKDPDDRWQSARDLTRELARIARSGRAPASARVEERAQPRSRTLVVGTAGVLVGGLLATLAWMAAAPSAPPSSSPMRRASLVVTLDGMFTVSLLNGRPALDAAGTVVVVGGRGSDGEVRLFARRFDQPDALPIPGSERAVDTGAFSPDGAWLAFVAGQQLRKVAMSGGAPQAIYAVSGPTYGLAWQGTESVIVGTSAGLVRVPASGGQGEPLTSVDANAGEIDHRWPSITPDGTTLAYVVWTGSGTARVRVRSLRTGVERTLMVGSAPYLTRSGHVIFGRNATLWAAPIDLETFEAGSEVPVVEGVNSQVNGSVNFAVSDDGMLVYSRRFERAAPLVRLDRSGADLGPIGAGFAGVHHGPLSVSPDGSRVAVCRHPVGGRDEVVIHDLRRGSMAVIGGAGDSRFPIWTPDGARLTFTSTLNGTRDIFEVPADLSAEPRPLLVREGQQIPGSWTPDGQTLVFTDGLLGSADIWVVSRNGEPAPLLANPAVSEGQPAFSKDGRWLAYVSNESGRPEVYVQGYPAAGRRLTVSAGGGTDPSWAKDGLYFQDLQNTVLFVPLAGVSALPVSVTPQRIANVGGSGGAGVAIDSNWGISPDGRMIVAIRDVIAPPGSLELVVNWFDELTRRVPAR